jgi:hypothetical protein
MKPIKIISNVIDGELIRIKTDNLGRPDFVYRKDKFDSKEKLLQEIEKSINLENNRKEKKEQKVQKLVSELNA